MIPLTPTPTALLLFIIFFVGAFFIVRAIFNKTIKNTALRGDNLIAQHDREKKSLDKIITSQYEQIERMNNEYSELRKQHEEVCSKWMEKMKIDEEHEKVDEENAQAFANLQKLYEEAEATIEVLLKYATGEITREEALAQVREVENKNVATEDQPAAQ